MSKSAFLKAAALAAIAATTAGPVIAGPVADSGNSAGKVCARHDALTKHLSASYAEQPLNLALDANGNMVEVYSSNQGSWTMVVITPAGVACVVATGEAKISLNPRPPGDRT